MNAYVVIFGLGFLACITITLAGVIIWEYLDKNAAIKKENEAEEQISYLTIEDIRKRVATESLSDIVSADQARFSGSESKSGGDDT